MMKKISRRSFLQVCGITAATAALTACGGGKTETAKKDDVHEAVTFMAPYKEIEAFIEQVHSVYPEVNIKVVPYSGDNTTTCLQNMFAAAFPIIGAGDVSGAVVLLAADGATVPSQTEIKLVQVAASFLGKQMEE